MAVAEAYLRAEKFKEVSNVSRSRPFDFTARKGRNRYIVEVKGTAGAGHEIILTRGEVKAHGERHPYNLLIVVHSIRLKRSKRKPIAKGGIARVTDAWRIDPGNLVPLSYSYVIP